MDPQVTQFFLCVSCPHARGGERGLKGSLALSKWTGKYSLAISGLGTASEGIPFFDRTGQYLRPDRPEGKKEFGENRSHPPVSKWESGLSAEEKYPFLLLSVFSLPSFPPTVTALTLTTTTTITPAPTPTPQTKEQSYFSLMVLPTWNRLSVTLGYSHTTGSKGPRSLNVWRNQIQKSSFQLTPAVSRCPNKNGEAANSHP